MIKTNAVDSFVINNIGDGNGEAKLYLRKNKSDTEYRYFFDINIEKYGQTPTSLNGEERYRDNGKPKNCYFLKSDIENYVQDQLDDDYLTSKEKRKLSAFDFDLIDKKNIFSINYVHDNQGRSYIGSPDSIFNILRYLSTNNKTIICIEEDDNENIKFSLEEGNL